MYICIYCIYTFFDYFIIVFMPSSLFFTGNEHVITTLPRTIFSIYLGLPDTFRLPKSFFHFPDEQRRGLQILAFSLWKSKPASSSFCSLVFESRFIPSLVFVQVHLQFLNFSLFCFIPILFSTNSLFKNSIKSILPALTGQEKCSLSNMKITYTPLNEGFNSCKWGWPEWIICWPMSFPSCPSVQAELVPRWRSLVLPCQKKKKYTKEKK